MPIEARNLLESRISQMKERKYNFRQLKEHFTVTGYQIEKMVSCGELEPAMPRTNESESRYWTHSQIRRCEQKLYEKSLPPAPVKSSTFKFSKKREARIRERALAENFARVYAETGV